MDVNELKDLWEFPTVEFQGQDKDALARIGGVNLRFDTAKAFTAVFHTCEACVSAGKLAFTGTLTGIVDPLEAVSLVSKLYRVVVTGLSALVEKVEPDEYVACVVLSRNAGPVSEADYRKQLDAFCQTYGQVKLPWYLGVSEKSVGKLSGILGITTPDGFSTLLGRLDKD